MARKIIAVTGATGAQGGGLVRAILADKEFAVRAITRKPDGDKAKELAKLGAEVVAADLDDEASLRKAFAGVVLIVVAALALKLVIGFVIAIFWTIAAIALAVTILWALKTLFW